MSQSLEDLIRTAQHEQAERAVDPRRILAALPRRRVRAVRRRRLVLATAAVAAVAAVAVAAVPLGGPRPGPAPQPPGASPRPSASVVDTRSVPLEFSPGWLPAGYAEYYRTVRPSTGLTRIWGSTPPKSPLLVDDLPGRLSMTVVATREAEEATVEPGDEPVDINGLSGVYRAAGSPALTWQSGGSTIALSAAGSVQARDTLLRIARSVRPDPTGTDLPFGLLLPPGQTVAAQTVSGVSPTRWLAVTDLGEQEPGGDVAASGTSVGIGTWTPAPEGGTALRVVGRSARYLYSAVPEGGHYLVVDFGSGLLLTVFSLDLDQRAMISLVEAAGWPNPPAAAWIGD